MAVVFSIEDFKEFNIDFAKKKITVTTGFLKPVHIVMLSAVREYNDFEISFLRQDIHRYAINMSYHEPLEIDTVDGLHHAKAIKLRDHFDNDEQVEKVVNVIRHNKVFDDKTLETLSVIISELFQNFYAHANIKEPPICCLQEWPRSDYLEIAIADKGIGIIESLKEIVPKHKEIENPCRLACQNGITSKEGKGHSGYGLFFTKRFIEENEGKLFLMSGQHCYENSQGIEQDHTLPYRWKGTVIRLIINKNNSIDTEMFFKQIAREQEGEDYDEFF